MSFIPMSVLFELAFIFLGAWLMKGNRVERILAIGLFAFAMILVGTSQVFIIINDSTGTISQSSIAFPSLLVGYVEFAFMLLFFLACFGLWRLIELERFENPGAEI